MDFVRACKYQWLKLKRIVAACLRAIVDSESVSVSSRLNIFPLRFKLQQDETEYLRGLRSIFFVSNYVFTSTTASFLLVYWISYGIAIQAKIFELSCSPLPFCVFHTSMIFFLAATLYYYYISLDLKYQKYYAPGLYLLTFLVAFLPVVFGWVAVWDLKRRFKLCLLAYTSLQMWVTQYQIGLSCCCVLLADIFLKPRTRIYGLFTACLITVHFLARLAPLLLHNQGDQLTTPIPSSTYVVLTTLESWTFLCILSLGFYARWSTELVERCWFLKFIEMSKKLELLQSMRSRKQPGCSTMEELLLTLFQIQGIFKECLDETNDELLLEAINDIERTKVMVLSDFQDLYSLMTGTTPRQCFTDEIALEEGEEKGDSKVSPEYFKNEDALGTAVFREFCFYECPELKMKDTQNCKADLPKENRFSAIEDFQPCRISKTSPLASSYASFHDEVGTSWNLDLIKYESFIENILVEVGIILLEAKCPCIGTTTLLLRRQLHQIQSLYLNNPYHNSTHGAMVAHTLHCILKTMGIMASPVFNAVDYTLIILAALGHDVGHPGRNNQFYSRTSHPLALLYNDKAILESYHAALLLRSLESETSNIFVSFNPKSLQEARRKIVDLILATNMGIHFDSISKFRLRRLAIGFDYLKNAEDMWITVKMALKCADLSHGSVKWENHVQWSLRVAEEFYQQGEEESSLGLPISPLCNRNKHSEFASSQRGFIEFVVEPLYKLVNEVVLDSSLADLCLTQLELNKQSWTSLLCSERSEPPEIPDHVKVKETDSSIISYLMLKIFRTGLCHCSEYLYSKIRSGSYRNSLTACTRRDTAIKNSFVLKYDKATRSLVNVMQQENSNDEEPSITYFSSKGEHEISPEAKHRIIRPRNSKKVTFRLLPSNVEETTSNEGVASPPDTSWSCKSNLPFESTRRSGSLNGSHRFTSLQREPEETTVENSSAESSKATVDIESLFRKYRSLKHSRIAKNKRSTNE